MAIRNVPDAIANLARRVRDLERASTRPTQRLYTPATFEMKAELDAWHPSDGTLAFLSSDNRHYARVNGVWRVIQARHVTDASNGRTYFGTGEEATGAGESYMAFSPESDSSALAAWVTGPNGDIMHFRKDKSARLYGALDVGPGGIYSDGDKIDNYFLKDVAATALPSSFRVGTTFGQVGSGFPTPYGVVETSYYNVNRGVQTVYDKDAGTSWYRTAANNAWGTWRQVITNGLAATQAQVNAGTDTLRYVTPARLAGKAATQSQVNAGTGSGFVTPSTLAGRTANILWSGAWFMNQNQTVNLSQAVSNQPSGIVLAWSRYSGGQAHNDSWNMIFVPKSQVVIAPGTGIYLSATTTATSAGEYKKYFYVSNTYIVGHNNNDTAPNNSSVLRYVAGV